MFFNFKKKKELKDDYNFIQEEYIKAIARDYDDKSLFSASSFIKTCIIKFSSNGEPRKILYRPYNNSNNNSYSGYSNEIERRKQYQKEDDELFDAHLSGDISASRMLGMPNQRNRW